MLLGGTLPAVDLVLTTVEIAQFLKSKGIDLKDCQESEFDTLLGQSSAAARLFGVSGGVSEATLRYRARRHGKALPIRIKQLRIRKHKGDKVQIEEKR